MTQEEQIQKSLDEITKQTADLMGRVQTEGVTHGGQFIIPPTEQYTPDLSQVDGAIAREKEYTALLESKQSEYEQLAKQREEELKQAETEQKSVLDRMKDLVGMAKPAEVREERLTDLGYDSAKFLAEQRADISEMEALRIDYDKAVAMRDQQIADIHGTAGIGMDFLNNAIAQINRNANVVLSQKASAINNKAAIMEMKQGNFNQAMSLADQAVEDFLYEIKFEYDMYHIFNQQNEDRINYLRGELKESLQTAEQYALAQYEEAKEEQMQVKNLMLQYPNSGIKIGDTLDEATQKASQWAGAQPVAGTGLTSQVIGGFEILKDAAGNIISTRQVGAGVGTEGWEVESLNPEQSAILDRMELEPYQQETVASIMRGESPPIPPNVARTEANLKIIGGLAALGFDNTVAYRDHTAMMNTVKNMTSAKAMELRRAIISLEGSTEQAERLYAEWQATGLPSGFSSYNRAALEVAARAPGQAGVSARTLISHIEDMAAELAVVYRGGGQATDDALAQARKSLSADWNEAQFAKNISLIRENLQIRRASINSAIGEVLEGTTYAPEITETPQKTNEQVFESEYNQLFKQEPPKRSIWQSIGNFFFGGKK